MVEMRELNRRHSFPLCIKNSVAETRIIAGGGEKLFGYNIYVKSKVTELTDKFVWS